MKTPLEVKGKRMKNAQKLAFTDLISSDGCEGVISE